MNVQDYEQIWQAMPNPGLTLDGGNAVRDLNGAAEHFLARSRKSIVGRDLIALAGEDSRLADLVGRVRAGAQALSEYNVEFSWPDAPLRMVDIFATPLEHDAILLLIHPRSNAEVMGR